MFIGTLSVPKQVSANSYVGSERKRFIVDKNTLKGSFYKLYNDFLGDIPLDWASFSNGYYVWNVEPGALFDALEKQLEENKEMSKKDRKRLTDLMNSIDENDNNYVIYAKLKR